jgi:hypothetical protein
MSNTKHTPGPWRVNETDYTNAYGIECEVNGIQHTVCTDQFCYPNFKKDRDPEKLANAKLIASAPSLLEALKDVISKTYSDNNGHWKTDMPNELYIICLNAIKQATE